MNEIVSPMMTELPQRNRSNPVHPRRKSSKEENGFSMNVHLHSNCRVEEESPTRNTENSNLSATLKKRIIFDSINIQFHLYVLVKNLCYHLFIPLFYFAKNKAAYGLKLEVGPFWYNIASPLLVYLMIASFLFCTENDKIILNNSMWMPLIFFLSHRLTIALKYATLSETEYKRYMRCQDEALLKDYGFQMQLFTGWHQMDPDVLLFEVSSASARIGERINHMHLIIRPELFSVAAQTQFRYWNAFLRGHSHIQFDSKPAPELKLLPCGNYALSVFDLCLAIVRRANQEDNLYPNTVIFIVVIAFVFIALAPVYAKLHEIDNPFLVGSYLLAVICLTVTFGQLYFFLLFVAMMDAFRQFRMVNILHCLIRLSELMMHANLTIGLDIDSDASYNDKIADSRRNDIFSITDKKDIRCYHATEIDNEYDIKNSSLQCCAFYSDASPQALVRRFIEADNIVFDNEAESMTDSKNDVDPSSSSKADYAMVFRGLSDLSNGNTVGAAVDDRVSLMPGQQHSIISATVSSKQRSTLASFLDSQDTIQENVQESFTDASIEKERGISTALGDQAVDDLSMAYPPRMAFEFPQNILAWTYARLTIQNYGIRFRYRIGIYVATTMLLTLALMIIPLLAIIQADDKKKLFSSSFVIGSVILVIMMSVFLVTYAHLGAMINTELDAQRRTLAARVLRVRTCIQRSCQSDDECNEQLECIAENLSTSMDLVDINNQLTPFKIIGLTAQNALTVSIITTLLSFFSVVFSLFFTSTGTAARA